MNQDTSRNPHFLVKHLKHQNRDISKYFIQYFDSVKNVKL